MRIHDNFHLVLWILSETQGSCSSVNTRVNTHPEFRRELIVDLVRHELLERPLQSLEALARA